MKNLSLLICAVFFLSLGCDQSDLRISKKVVVSEAAKEPLIKKIDSPQLARMILKPERHELKVNRDPFTPLFTTKDEAKAASSQVKESASLVEDVVFLGVVRINDEYLALLKDKSEKGVFRINEKIKDFTITDIKEEEVTLNNGVRTIKLKRGDNP